MGMILEPVAAHYSTTILAICCMTSLRQLLELADELVLYIFPFPKSHGTITTVLIFFASRSDRSIQNQGIP